ncbi:cyanophycin synthetase [Tellurirhabdus rosea]|uniref:cyanophycin synthetase n=1 Tax=Tellurirhabdus rosea TaxID=2674997 RepID=UPI00225670F1|nr:cyanophycin synthetase [Tellurirhabdus rosea]
MKLVAMRCLRGPNFWSVSRHNLVAMRLDLEELEEHPTNTLEGFLERLTAAMPSLYDHHCSEGHPGGFFERVREGTWMGHVVEHLALELQGLAGMNVGFGQTRGTGERGVYHVVFACREERAGMLAGGCAVDLAQALVDGKEYDVAGAVERIRQLYEADKLGPSTAAIVDACRRKGVPTIRLDADSTIQLGYGARQKRIQATVSSQTSAIAMDLAADKDKTKQVLEEAGIPVPTGRVIGSEEELQEVLRALGFPLVVKPLDGNHGRGVTTNIRTASELFEAWQRARVHSKEVIVEQFVSGNDYRLLVIDFKLCAVAQRLPALVVGDGFSTIRELIDVVNRDERRGTGHQNVLTRIELDEATLALLRSRHLSPESVLPQDEVLYLKKTANLSTGGTSIDRTDEIHPELARMAERIARVIGLDICGIDLIAHDITVPLQQAGAAVIEVNAGPGLRMHTHPTEGKPRDVGQAIADMLFPNEENGRIPLIAITGTNGKTSTTRLIAHIFKGMQKKVGFTTTEGIYLGDDLIERGDCTGPISAGKILRDSSVEVAVLECARGGILRAGLAFDQCDVGVVTNVAADHLGLEGILTVEDMARVKSVIPETVRKGGYAVLNADNDYTYAMREEVRSEVALFSRRAGNERVQQHRQTGGLAAICDGGWLKICRGDESIPLVHVRDVPLTFNGTCGFMIENVLAAALACYCQNVPVDVITEGLRTFVPTHETTPGRMNVFQLSDIRVVVDYAHNPHGLIALSEFVQNTEASRRIGIVTGVGDRRDDDIRQIGRIAAETFDEIIIRIDEDTRDRPAEQIAELLQQGIAEVAPDKAAQVVPSEEKALRTAIDRAPSGALVMHLTEKIEVAVQLIKRLETQRKPVAV